MELLKKFSEAVANCPVGFNDGLGVGNIVNEVTVDSVV